MPITFALPALGFLHLEADTPVYSPVNLHGGMPVFSPYVVTEAINTAFSAALNIAIEYHVDKAQEHLMAKNYFLAKIHADAADAIKAKGDIS